MQTSFIIRSTERDFIVDFLTDLLLLYSIYKIIYFLSCRNMNKKRPLLFGPPIVLFSK